MSLLSPFTLYSFNPTPPIRIYFTWWTPLQEEEVEEVGSFMFGIAHISKHITKLPIIAMIRKER